MFIKVRRSVCKVLLRLLELAVSAPVPPQWVAEEVVSSEGEPPLVDELTVEDVNRFLAEYGLCRLYVTVCPNKCACIGLRTPGGYVWNYGASTEDYVPYKHRKN